MSCLRWRTPASTFCCGSKGLVTFSCRAVCGISCISPIAPLRDTALGLKFDSTLMTARTRLGSTLWREAAWSMAASMSCGENDLPRTKPCDVLSPGCSPRYWLTSAAAERAARTLAEGTGFQRCSVVLQNASEFRRTGASERLLETTEKDSLT